MSATAVDELDQAWADYFAVLDQLLAACRDVLDDIERQVYNP